VLAPSIKTGGMDSRFSAPCRVFEGETVTLIGSFVNDPRWGWQFKATSKTVHIPTGISGLSEWLSANPDFKGIGPTRARKIVNAIPPGEDLTTWLDSPTGLTSLRAASGLGEVEAETFRDNWRAWSTFNSMAVWLSGFGLTYRQTVNLIKSLGGRVKGILEENPYAIMDLVDGFGFMRSDLVALKMGVLRDDPRRIDAAIIHALKVAEQAGSCWVESEELTDEVVKLLAIDTFSLVTLIRERILAAPKDALTGISCIPFGQDGRECHAIGRTWLQDHEKLLFDNFTMQVETEEEDEPERQPASLPESLNTDQYQAAQAALACPMVLITGGAGTGKTYTVSAIVRALKADGKQVCLCAPTGKAARRLAEMTGEDGAQTVHRLLGYNGRGFEAERPLPYDAIIIDEVSMVDSPLFAALLARMDYPRTTLIMVGDHHQLPPVGPGNVLRDLVAADGLGRSTVKVCHLGKVVRQAGTLKTNSTAILSGIVYPTAGDAKRPREGEKLSPLLPWYNFTNLSERSKLLDFLDSLFQDRLKPYGLDPFRDVQVLSPLRKGPLGVNAINRHLQWVAQTARGVEIPRPQEEEGTGKPGEKRKKTPRRFYRWDKVIYRKNDYNLDLMNGQTGVVVRVDEAAGEIECNFDGRPLTLERSKDYWEHLELAYCLTVHQVQGSEWPFVVVICHKDHSFFWSRNLLYTAVTRARRAVMLVGDGWTARKAAGTATIEARKTWLRLALEG
jgi:exodeoxyribonuclease V alpha subunit